MEIVHQINSYVCLCSGIALNSLLVWLIWKKTNGEVRYYSWILIQGCIVDSIYLIVASIVQPDFLTVTIQVISVKGGDVLFSESGIFRYSSRSVNRITFHIWIFAYNFTKFSPLNQFYYRYLVLCRGRRVSWQTLLPSFLLITVLSILVPRSSDLLWVVCVTIAFDFVVFQLIIWLAYQVWYTLRTSLNQITKETRSKIFNKQINIALLIQVFLPVIVSSIPIIYLAHAIITKSGIVTICQLMTIPLHWIPVSS
ncbi:serpentine type 7TM GPCR chemoreceptor str domain-containing protein [Ditylenchus destructor]|uniref:Serpentine type 7TM GPCR chemoreceptor str domain-containing protein n=1 Tax=Ditylenchus destructor TaxID=166010 RepID=A0AAD4N2J9_9BILA|nr:serpentine type 7TM GPCR chemoreceptor str domain-containing protein [Ditylenchus destructor]